MIEVMKQEDGVKAFFSTRNGGESQEKYESLNVGFHVGDDPERVKKNHKIIQRHFTMPNEIFYMDQIHSKQVCEVGSSEKIPQGDALISKESQKILMVMVADCIPILFFDKKRGVIAAIHAGRKGVFLNIVAETLNRMQDHFGSQAEDIHVAIGPHIKGCCYEVGQEIVQEAENLGLQGSIELKKDHYYLDLYPILMQQLLQAGVKEESIESIDHCTACHTDDYFSYRKEGATGRFCGVIMLE